jgi:hypothetical protein
MPNRKGQDTMGTSLINIEMGQGVVAPFGNDLQTSAMPSCLGIAFINKQRRMAGLFHYPAKAFSGERDEVRAIGATMVAMNIDFDPQEIYVTPAMSHRSAHAAQQEGSSPEDIKNLEYFLKKYFGFATITNLPASAFASVTTSDGNITFNTARLASSEFDVDKHVKSNMPQTTGVEVPRISPINEAGVVIFFTP